MSLGKGMLTFFLIEAILIFLLAVLPDGVIRGLVLFLIFGVFLFLLLLMVNAMFNYSIRTREPHDGD
ncbi:MAG: hypothetical protein C0631_09145 [Sedimenticola sp.]|jgi:hypothetical protein|nr:MAG: hypothetical protein C0631_09145 [Sedimenticola sp.]